MLFKSYEFLFAFLPLTLAGFFLLGHASRAWAIRWIIAASVFFYAWWRPLNVFIMAPSVLINYLLARTLQRLGEQERTKSSRGVLALGIAFNIAFLGYFKYANFAAEAANDLLGTGFVMARVILPLGISFITFQKIAFLVDVQAKRVTSFTLQDFGLFVLFFPQLISGPIVHYREMMPQFHAATGKADAGHLSVGITLIVFGLFKKVVLADGIAPYVGTIFSEARLGQPVTFLPAWMAAIGFTFQIYFDFSGYTDMALGAARCFGIRFPPNFDSPLKASSIIDFWMRWHMTLTRFLTAYVYNPMALALTRRRMAGGKPAFGGRNTTVGAFVSLLAVPTLITMVLSGLWHGAGYLFILWGFVHGVYLCINHGWRFFAHRWWPDRARYNRLMRPIGFVLTFLSVVTAMVLFRSPTVAAARVLLKGLVGANGVTLPGAIYNRLGSLPSWIHGAGEAPIFGSAGEFGLLARWIFGLGVVALAFPNTLQLLAPTEPALGYRTPWALPWRPGRPLAWQPTVAWAALVAVIAVAAVLHLGGKSEFLYWQF